jgi:hypothetical protein
MAQLERWTVRASPSPEDIDGRGAERLEESQIVL